MSNIRLIAANSLPDPVRDKNTNPLPRLLLILFCNAAICFWAYTLYTGPISARNRATHTSQPTCVVCGKHAIEKAQWEGRSGARIDPSSEAHYCLAHYPRTLYQPKTWGINILIGAVGLVLMLVFLNLSFWGRERDWYDRWIDAGGFLAAVSLLLLFACFEHW